jgi:hypothetical protein
MHCLYAIYVFVYALYFEDVYVRIHACMHTNKIVCIPACIYIYIYIYIYIDTKHCFQVYAHTQAHVYVNACICAHAYIYIYIHTYIHTYRGVCHLGESVQLILRKPPRSGLIVYLYTCMYTSCIFEYTCTYISRIYMYIHPVCIYHVYIYIYIYEVYIYTYIYIYISIYIDI